MELNLVRVTGVVMKFRTKLHFIIFMISELVSLVFLGYVGVEPSGAANIVLGQELSFSALVSEQPHLTLVSIFPLVAEGKIVGVLAAYNDATTKRTVDYWEVYDSENHLVVVSWFDRFGIERTAVDRGLLKDADTPEGVFVPVIEGDSV
jgi:hypothetical protein